MGPTILITLELVAVSTWVGSLVCLAVVARVSRRVLDPPARVALFRAVGRRYAVLGPACLAVAVGVGLVLARPLSQAPAGAWVALGLGLALGGVTAAGMGQARRMTVRRGAALGTPADGAAAAAVRRGARVAAVLRGAIGALTVAILVLGAHLVAP